MIKNTLEALTLTSRDVEGQIMKIHLSFMSVKDDEMEWKTMPPMFVPPFYRFVLIFNRIPLQQEYWKYYYKLSETEFTDYLRQNIDALKARLYRAYPSFVRDIHFYCLLRESKQFKKVIYNTRLDVEQGINFVVQYGSQLYCISCYIDTIRAYEGRQKKQFRHKNPNFCISINLPVSFRGSNRCGEFFLYSDKEVNYLLSLIKKRLSSGR